MKMYKKSDLTIINGMLVSETGDIVFPGYDAVCEANELETLVQKAAYLAKQPSATPMPSLDGFERKTESKVDVKFTATTPTLDSKMAEAMDLMDELDDIETVNQANDMVAKFSELLRFVDTDYVVGSDGPIVPFDTPTLGNVLELTKEDVAEAIAFVCGMDKEGLTKAPADEE